MSRRERVKTFKQRDDWLRAVSADGDLPPAVRLIAIRMGLFLNCKTGQCNPSYWTLAAGLKISKRAAIRAVAVLESAGWLIAVRSRGGLRANKNEYQLHIPEGVTPESPVRVSPESPQRVTPQTGTGDRRRTERVTPVSPITTKENSEGNSVYISARPSASPIDKKSAAEAFEKFWTAYPHRVARKAARQEFVVAVERGIDPATLIEGAHKYASAQVGQRFTKEPANWLREERWTDQARGPLLPDTAPDDPWKKMAAKYARGRDD